MLCFSWIFTVFRKKTQTQAYSAFSLEQDQLTHQEMMKPPYLCFSQEHLINLISLLLHNIRKIEHMPSIEQERIVLHRLFFTMQS